MAEQTDAAAPGMSRFRLVIAYDGTAYAGWQVQKTGLGVQQRVEESLARLFPGVGRVHSSSRTDTGVHALGMVVHVDIPRARMRMAVSKLAIAINAHLPQDIRVVRAARCRRDFHARFDASGKEYRYTVWNHPVQNPLLRHTAWHVPKPLDLAAMRQAAACLPGTRDFRAFAAHHTYEIENTVRTLRQCAIRRQGSMLTFVIRGDGFLYKMCRSIVGTLVQVGQGKYPPAEVGRMLATCDRREAGMTAPAQGLVLWRVFYRKKAAIPDCEAAP
jgi:tRNA pseudouridine38-40 synthase